MLLILFVGMSIVIVNNDLHREKHSGQRISVEFGVSTLRKLLVPKSSVPFTSSSIQVTCHFDHFISLCMSNLTICHGDVISLLTGSWFFL
jgi:hypothetical protein